MRRRKKNPHANHDEDNGIERVADAGRTALRGEEYFRALIENASDVITILEDDGTIRYESPSVKRFLGWEPEELVGKNVFDYLHPEDAPLALEAFQGGLDTPGNSSYMEVRFRHKDDSWRWFGGIGSNLLHDEAVRGILLNSHDVTERVEAERELAENRRALVTLLGNLPGMAYRCRNDRDWTNEFASAGCLPLTGYQPSDLVGNRAVSYGSLIHPDDREAVWQSVQEALSRREPFEIVYRIKAASGEEKWVWEQGRGIFSPLGDLQALEGFVTDITARVGAERLLRTQRDLAFRLSESFELQDILEALMRAVMEVTGMDCGAIYLLDEAMEEMRIAYYTGLSDAFVAEVARYDFSSPTARLVAAGSPLYREHGEFQSPPPASSEAEGIRSAAIVPIFFEGRVIGCLNAASHVLEEIPRRSRDAVEVFAAIVGQAVARSWLVSALRESEERYRLLHDNAGEAIFTYDSELRLVNMNSMACEKIGYGEKELLGKNIMELGLVLEEDLEKAWREIEALLKGEKTVASEVIRLRRKDGRILVAEMTGAALYGEGGRLIGVSNIVMDVTERVATEEALWESEERYRATFESTGTAMCVIGKDGIVSIVNSEFERMLGYTREEVEGRRRYWEFIHAGDAEAVIYCGRLIGLGKLATPFQYECRLMHKEGGVISVLASVNAAESMESSIVSVLDITDRKQAEEALRKSEERYRATFESTGTAMFLVERDGMLSDANAEMERIFGYSLEEVVGKKRYMELVMPGDVEKVKENSRRLLEGKLPSPLTYEIKARHKSGRPVDAIISVGVLPGIDKSVVSLVDITDKKAYERELEKNAEQQRDFLDIAAHELRHPATLLKGYAMTLARRGEDIGEGDRRACLRGIEAGADRLVYVVEELLDAARLQRGKFSLKREKVSVREIALRAVEEIRMSWTQREVRLDVPDDAGESYADPDRIVRLFVILLDNALKYSPPGSLVEIAGERRGGEIIFSVLDRGGGIPPEDGERVFDRFYQVGSAKHHSGPGLGLGLYIGKRIIDAHGGRIWYEPREGGGSAFRFSIPIR